LPEPWNHANVATVTKPLLLAALALAAFVLVYPLVRDRLPDRISYLGNRAPVVAQSASQLSSSEFGRVDSGFTPNELRAFAGNPATKTKAAVEGVDLECWYYGIAGARGAYQICFENGRLSTKARFDRG
jgi:hypothetical protein